MTRFDTVLVANRGEIARRIFRTAKQMGYRTVAVFDEADRALPFVSEADIAISLGSGGSQATYLNADKILAAAHSSGAGAIHPGYGFLSENEQFAKCVHEAGLVWVGPPAEAIASMGSKIEAKKLVEAAGVVTVPGYHDTESLTGEQMQQRADEVGYPLFIKAAAGGGGRGMRLVHRPEEFQQELSRARSEALGSFGSDEVLLERALFGARHVEIQVFADEAGQVVCLGERDCSIQRRHQKIVEESPAPGLSSTVRTLMEEAAMKVAASVGYVGAGTAEFLVAEDGAFYFLEMNTRLQVEHPVTEACFDVDLVSWQFQVAQGEPLPIASREAIEARRLAKGAGHAIEVRLYAEDPSRDFMPQAGHMTCLKLPQGEGIRVDVSLAQRGEVSAQFDPMIAKVIASGRTRDEARRRLIRSLESSTVLGVKTNRDFLIQVLRHAAFAKGSLSTQFLKDHDISTAPSHDLASLAKAMLVHHLCEAWSTGQAFQHEGAWQRLVCQVEHEEATQVLEYRASLGEVSLRSPGGGTQRWEVIKIQEEGAYRVTDPEGRTESVFVGWRPLTHTLTVQTARGTLGVRDCSYDPELDESERSEGRVLAPMTGRVLDVMVTSQQHVKQDDLLGVVEAMKMEHKLVAQHEGVVSVLCEAGAQVKEGELLFEVHKHEPGEG